MFRLPRRRGAARRRGTASRPGTGLQVCIGCHADHVHPVEWRESGDEHWWMLLRCGTCRTAREVVVTNEIAERYGRDLDAAQAEMARAALKLDVERMAAEAETFAAALERDLIDADDFARPIGR
jgi:hypothetical protein